MMAWNELTVMLLVYIVPIAVFFALLYVIVRKAVSDGMKKSLKDIANNNQSSKFDEHGN